MEDDDVSNGRQVSYSSISSKSRSHKKRDKVAAGLESNFAMIAQDMHNIADAINEINVYSFVDELYEGVMKMEGFDEVQLASAFDYLIVNETVARAFNKKGINLRRLWLEKFFNQHI
ncbi:hypothetical protein CJ030_MR4G028670 [Morella rubra]|uniref:Uncharacterized protein n=1 Tax=Morella rubra TaxID=262757 RepID=A0A6A1VV20_9ROSI|nr:hypothetical protein CJ030_MR4G028670 [Morella rubra]